MISFLNDYCEGCFPEILKKLEETNYEKITGYGMDDYCLKAVEKIRNLCECPGAEVFFLSGGTQTNQIVIDSLLDSFDGVLAADSGHVSVHEAGAVEYTGHKVLTLAHQNGKITAEQIRKYLVDYYDDDNHEHMVRPGMVYISHPSELGTLYSKEELTNISSVCREYKIPLFLDGARLACALTAADNDVTLQDIARLTDVFYMGGTKCGALYGEALVFTHNNMPFRFNSRVKQHGALLAKGWIPGLMFDVMLTPLKENGSDEDCLYYQGGRNANLHAAAIRSALRENGYTFYVDSPTNQIFVIVDHPTMQALSEKVVFSFFEKYDESRTVIRFVTSWATKEEDVKELCEVLKQTVTK